MTGAICKCLKWSPFLPCCLARRDPVQPVGVTPLCGIRPKGEPVAIPPALVLAQRQFFQQGTRA